MEGAFFANYIFGGGKYYFSSDEIRFLLFCGNCGEMSQFVTNHNWFCRVSTFTHILIKKMCDKKYYYIEYI